MFTQQTEALRKKVEERQSQFFVMADRIKTMSKKDLAGHGFKTRAEFILDQFERTHAAIQRDHKDFHKKLPLWVSL